MGYIRAPRDHGEHDFTALRPRYAIVCRSGIAETNRWIAESHNVAADYLRAFGKPATHVKVIRLQINSQHTGSAAESYFADLVFRNESQ